MRLDSVGFFVGKTSLLALTQLLDEAHRLPLEATGEFTTNAAGEQLHQLSENMIRLSTALLNLFCIKARQIDSNLT